MDRWPGGRSSPRRLPIALELPQERASLRDLERRAPLAGVVKEAAAGLGTQLVVRHLPLDQARGLEARVAERLAHVATRSEERRVGTECRSGGWTDAREGTG